MTRHVRALILLAGALVLAADVAALGYAFTRGGGSHIPRLPGRVAVRQGCGLIHMWPDGSDQRNMCLNDVFDEISLSLDGRKLAWDTKAVNAILVAGADGSNPVNAPLPLGANVDPTLDPDGDKIAFLHSPRNDGRYDVWVTELQLANAEQLTNTRNVSDVAWSPKGDWLAYVQNWSDSTLEGQISLIRPNGNGSHTIVDGDSPDWSPDGKHLIYFHHGGVWSARPDGADAHLLVPNAHSPAWSRNGKQIAFMRAERCRRAVCREHVFVAFANGTGAKEVGPVFREERRVLWLPDPFE